MKEMAFMAATAILFVAVATAALFVWHSWYLYCGAVLTGYVALTLLTVLLKRSLHIEYHYFEQYIHDKSCFYNRIAICFEALGVMNALLLFAVQASVDTRAGLMVTHLVIANFFLMFAVWCCEGKDWKFWLPKALFE